MRLLLVRHGATPNNVEARYTGQTDVPMSELGERQAEAVAQRLAALHLDLMVTSDLVRARTTAERIARAQSCELRVDPDLREVSMGAWEGLSIAEAEVRYGDEIRLWRSDTAHYAPPGGESLEQFTTRVARALDRWAHREAGERVLLVTHGGVIGVALCLTLGLPLAHRGQFVRDNTSITELKIKSSSTIGQDGPRPRRRGKLVRLNDTAHLEGIVLPSEGERSQVL